MGYVIFLKRQSRFFSFDRKAFCAFTDENKEGQLHAPDKSGVAEGFSVGCGTYSYF